MEGIVKQVRTTRHRVVKTCDANMCPEDFKKSFWFKKQTHVYCGARRRRLNLQIQRPDW